MGKVKFEFDPWEITGLDVEKSSSVREAKQAVAEYVRDQVLDYVGEAKSPVAGEGWKRSLSKKYAEKKSGESSSVFANMELTGEMLDSLEVNSKRGSKLVLQLNDELSDKKADNHNHFKKYGDPTVPRRRFIPAENQTFKREIVSGIKDILKGYEDGKD